MFKYYIEYPRNFANEYTVYIVSKNNEKRFLELLGDKVKRISRKEAIEKGYYAPKRAKKENIQFFGGFYLSDNYNQDLADSIYDCITSTEDLLNELDQ